MRLRRKLRLFYAAVQAIAGHRAETEIRAAIRNRAKAHRAKQNTQTK